MTRSTRTYDHFCSMARALEKVGDRWALLIVRDLVGGPRRFTDLMDRLGGITPKTLGQRLREMTAAGLVEVDRVTGRREVWYRLSPAGQELAPVVATLTLWGMRHVSRPPLPGEAVHPEHLLNAVQLVLNQTPPPPSPLTWRFTFLDDAIYTLHFDGQEWAVFTGTQDHEPAVSVRTTTSAWLDYLMTPPAARPTAPRGIDLEGDEPEVQRFTELLARFPDGVQ
jgi:DNA-binding HxlR family transcriptional regulator